MNCVILGQLVSFELFESNLETGETWQNESLENLEKVEISEIETKLASENQSGKSVEKDEKKEEVLEIFFLHGWRSQKEVWQSLIHSLIEKWENKSVENSRKMGKIRIWTIDLPGFGGSTVPKEAWSVGNYADLVESFIIQKSSPNSKKVLVGHSFGGRISIKLIAKNSQQNFLENNLESKNSSIEPNCKIDKLVLIGSAGFACYSIENKLKKVIAKILKPLFKPSLMQALRRKIYTKMGSDDYLETPELVETFKLILDEDLTEDMKLVKSQTLLIYGQKDTEAPPEFGRRMLDLMTNSRLEIISNAGHFTFLDELEIVSDLVWDFLNTP